MAAKELTIIHHPTHCEFFIDDKKITINNEAYSKHYFLYNKVTFVTFRENLYNIPARYIILMKLFSRGKAVITNKKGKEKSLHLPRFCFYLCLKILRAIKRFVFAYKYLAIYQEEMTRISNQFSLMQRVHKEIEDLSFQALKVNFHSFKECPAKKLDISKPAAYLCTYVGEPLRAGGSLGHIAGVLNNLEHFTVPPVFITSHKFPTIDKEIETHLITPTEDFNYFSELQLLHFSENFTTDALVILKDIDPGFIYQRYYLFNTSGARIARELNIPFILEFNGSEIWVNKNWGESLTYESVAEFIELCNLHLADLIVVVSNPIRTRLIEQGFHPEKILVNPNGVDTDKYSPEINGNEIRERYNLNGKIVLGFIGTFGFWHGAEVLAEAFGEFITKYPDYKKNVRLLMIGDGSKMSKIKEQVAHYGIQDYCILTGIVPQEEGPNYLAACDILVSPHIPNPDGTPFFGSPTKIFEYLAMEKGIIASNLEQIGDILEHKKTAWMVKPGDVDELIEGFKVLIEDETLRESLGKSARVEVSAHYTWKEHTRRIIEKMQDCLQPEQKD